jgi:hypothetical protein
MTAGQAQRFHPCVAANEARRSATLQFRIRDIPLHAVLQRAALAVRIGIASRALRQLEGRVPQMTALHMEQMLTAFYSGNFADLMGTQVTQ